jgi:hypothetical protein
MKSHFLSIILLGIFLFNCTSDRVEPRILILDGKSYEVVSRSKLAANMTYLLVRETNQAFTKAFLETESGLTTTVFSETELRTYLSSGNLEDLGKVMTIKGANNAVMRYVVKGNTNVFVLKENHHIELVEYEGSVDSPVSGSPQTNKPTGPGTPPVDPYEVCTDKCGDSYNLCMGSPYAGVRLTCNSIKSRCMTNCRTNYPQ